MPANCVKQARRKIIPPILRAVRKLVGSDIALILGTARPATFHGCRVVAIDLKTELVIALCDPRILANLRGFHQWNQIRGGTERTACIPAGIAFAIGGRQVEPVRSTRIRRSLAGIRVPAEPRSERRIDRRALPAVGTLRE